MIGHHIHGHGPIRAVVLHGWFGDWRIFEPMLPALDPEVFTLAFLDARGYGASKGAPGPFDMGGVAADAEALADQLGWNQFSVVGHSMGGKAALRLAVRIPDRVRNILALTPVWAGPGLDTDTLQFFRAAVEDLSVRAAIIDNTTGGVLPKAWSRRQAELSAEVSSKSAFAAYLESWAGEDFADQARQLPHRALVVVGQNDAGVTESMARQTWLDGLKAADLIILPGAGHYPMVEAPLRLASIFEQFLTAGG